MRSLVNVINRMISVIPPSEWELLYSLKEKRNSVMCAAPELQTMWWNLTYETLCEYVFNRDSWEGNHWQENLRKIWVGEE